MTHCQYFHIYRETAAEFEPFRNPDTDHILSLWLTRKRTIVSVIEVDNGYICYAA